MKSVSLRWYFLLFCLGLNLVLQAQDIEVFHENTLHGYILYTSNSDWYPVSIELEVDTTNMSFSKGSKKLFIVPARTSKLQIGELTARANASYQISYKVRSAMGDVSLTGYDSSFVYDLPFQNGKHYKLSQGYNGSSSHQHENSLDFMLPEGTKVLAAREGIIVQVVQNNTESCPREECKKYNNYITIMHSDGTFASYAHIRHNSVRLKLGQHVRKGDVIALSGDVGYTSGPHLHFVCFLGGFDGWNTVKTKFMLDKGDKAMFLQEGNIYTRNY